MRRAGAPVYRQLSLWALLALVAASPCRAAQATPDWRMLEAEALTLLSRYIQINTVNPPGDEIRAAQFFKEIFDREGVEARVIESAPGRGNIYARLKGNGSKKALLLLHHMDVVPANARLWKKPPFSGAVEDGYIWGRGALDMKGPAMLQLAAFLALKRSGIALRGDVIFLGTADEEAGGALGAGYLLDKHPELFKDVGLVLNEGGGIRLGSDGRARIYSASVAEKTPLWLRLTANGSPGHGATPRNNSAVNKLIAALNRLAQYQSPVKAVPEVQKFYADLAPSEPEERRARYRDLKTALQNPTFLREFTRDPRNNASVRNTIAITRVQGSEKVNVVPAEAWAEIDVRLLPGEEPQAFVAELKRVIADEAIKIDILLSFPPAASPSHPEALSVLRQLADAVDGGAPLVSPLVRGFTDCHFFREKNIPCIGFMPLRQSLATEGLTHGVDERLSIASFNSGIRMMYEVVKKLSAAP